jgi:hypothetical protein
MARDQVIQQGQNDLGFIAAICVGLLGIGLDVHSHTFPFADIECQGPVIRLSGPRSASNRMTDCIDSLNSVG